MRRKRFTKRSVVMKLTTNRREHHVLYDREIHGDCCFICSKRCGEWVDCWRINDRQHDNPKKSWKYRYKKRNQWMAQDLKPFRKLYRYRYI